MTRRQLLHLGRLAAALILLAAVVASLVVAYHTVASLRLARSYMVVVECLQGGRLPADCGSRLAGGLRGVSASLPGDLAALDTHLSELRRWGAPVLWVGRSGWLPVVGGNVQALSYLFDAACELAAASRAAAALAPPILDALTAQGHAAGMGALPQALAVLAVQRPALQAAQVHTAAAALAQSHAPARSLPGRAGALAQRLEDYTRLLDAALAAAGMAPAVLGGDRPRTYLLIAQNSDELRASGGFLSAAGTITLNGGQVTQFDLRDSYAGDDLSVPHPQPPEALQRLMGAGVLLLRDVNWWPDFATTAAMTMQVWELDRKQRVDGVIALDEEGLRLIVEGLGSLTVEGEDAPLVAGDLRDLLRQKYGTVPEGRQAMGAWWRHRKDFLPVLAGSVLAKVQGGLSVDEAWGVARALLRAVAGKHLQAYASDPTLQALIEQLGAGGRIVETAGDYLFVVDSNVGFNKVNANIEQRIDYAVDLTGAPNVQASLTVTYTNHAAIRLAECVLVAAYGVTYGDMMERCYWDYVRVYAPIGSTALLAAGSPAVETLREAGKQVFASSIVTAPGESEELRLRYALPAAVVQPAAAACCRSLQAVDRQSSGDSSRYTLLVQKQGGVLGHELRISVALPASARLLAADPPPSAQDGDTLYFELTLDRDRTIEVTYGH